MNPTQNFLGQGAFLTGASFGMGLATARSFAEAAAAAALGAAAKELTDAGHQVLTPCAPRAAEPSSGTSTSVSSRRSAAR
ncbi:hypothetical protein [Streptomyces variegatus]|uniref:hypothetical protein n=1 Tax=Streptomyces variegatus TaxID=284040 RepID=UPI003C2E7BF8